MPSTWRTSPSWIPKVLHVTYRLDLIDILQGIPSIQNIQYSSYLDSTLIQIQLSHNRALL